jgi:hypothetical protein
LSQLAWAHEEAVEPDPASLRASHVQEDYTS